MLMEWLMCATGFTGALSLIFLARLVRRSLGDAPSADVYFSPKGGCTEAIAAHLAVARTEVLVLARSFASEKLAKALLDAKMRGVRIEIILDRQNEKDPTSDLHLFAEQGLAPALDTHFTCCHDNLMVIDGRTVILGSFDFTRQAEEENSDSLLILTGHSSLASECRKHFQAVKAHAQEVRRPNAAKPVEKPAEKQASPPPKLPEKPAPPVKIEMPASDQLEDEEELESPAALLQKLSRKVA